MKLQHITALIASTAALAGCAGGTGDADPTTSPQAASRDKAVSFSECMRDNGVTDFPDPDASGSLTIDGVLNGSNIDSEGPVWKGAIETCRNLQPAGFTGAKRRTKTQKTAALAFADCIRQHGVHDFPDPVDGQPLIDTRRIPSTDTPEGHATLRAAMQTCKEQADQAIAER
jgi:hypothetical protein